MASGEDGQHYVELCDNPIRFEPVNKANNVFFDDANRQVFGVRGKGAMGVVVKGPSEKSVANFRTDDKGDVISIKFSPDRRILAIQRTSRTVDYVNFREDMTSEQQEYTHQCKTLKPGVTVTLPHRRDLQFHRPYFSSVCLAPRNSSSIYRRDATRWKLKNAAQVALLYVLLQKNLHTTQALNPEFQEQCVNTRAVFHHKFCQDDRYLAIRLCGPLLNLRHRFLNCLGRGLVMKVFERCVAWACFGQAGGKLEACQWFHQTLHHKGCRRTRLMTDIGCDDQKRKHYRNHVFNPSPRIDEIFGY